MRVLLLFSFLICSVSTYCQVTISGPTCATPGVSYQYQIYGPFDTSTVVQVCTVGGVIGNGSASCTSGTKLAYVMVVWNPNVSSANITVSSSAGNGNLNVSIFQMLNGGQILNTNKSQSIGYDSIPPTINCSSATGGGCSVNYSYQWQSSLNNVVWSNISGATNQNLQIHLNPLQTTFYRRMVTEKGTLTIGYSDASTVFVGPPPPGKN